MVTILSVAEKPSVAKELANIISRGAPISSLTRPSLSKFNPVYEIQSCPFKDTMASMKITSVTGHIMEIEFDAKYKNWTESNPIDLFTAPIYKDIKSENIDIKNNLINEIKNCNILLLWLDCDLEGENIAYEVINICKEKNKRIDIYRAKFSALIERDIFYTLRNPERPNPYMNDAVDARQEIDLRVGAAFTRFQTLRIRNKYDISISSNSNNIKNSSVISYGPCQFPTLGFVVERDLERKNFKIEKFWYLKCYTNFLHPDNNENILRIDFKWEKNRIFDNFATFLLYENCIKDENLLVTNDNSSNFNEIIKNYMNKNNLLLENIQKTVAIVTKVNERLTSRRRPIPLNTIELQIMASKYLRMPSDKAMSIAEDLYQRGIISYPRTETNFYKDGFELINLISEHKGHSLWGSYVESLLNPSSNSTNSFKWPYRGNKDDQAHPPIHPTKSMELNQLKNDDERSLYELICRHFIASCSSDAQGSLTQLQIALLPFTRLIPIIEQYNIPIDFNSPNQISKPISLSNFIYSNINNENNSSENVLNSINLKDSEYFNKSGLMIIALNYLDIYGKYDHWNGNKVPYLQIGDIFFPNFEIAEGETCPPGPITESDLIATMDSHGIGTDATIATHISTIQQREYVKKINNNCFEATPLGLALVEGYNSMGFQLNKPQLRATIEKECQNIAQGKTTKEEVLKKCLNLMKNCYETCLKDIEKLDFSMRKYFSTIGNSNDNNYYISNHNLSTCGKCHDGMELRIENSSNSNSITKRYLYCRNCSVGLSLPPRGELSQHEASCKICDYQVLTVTNKEKNTEHTICPYCFSNPPLPPIGTDGINEFRCFNCANIDCDLAKRRPISEIALCSSPNCNGYWSLNKNKSNNYYFYCTNSKINSCKNIYLPNFIKDIIVPNSQNFSNLKINNIHLSSQYQSINDLYCLNCKRSNNYKVMRLIMKFNMATAPPGLQPEELICPVCSPFLYDNITHFSLKTKSENSSQSSTQSSSHSSIQRHVPVSLSYSSAPLVQSTNYQANSNISRSTYTSNSTTNNNNTNNYYQSNSNYSNSYTSTSFSSASSYSVSSSFNSSNSTYTSSAPYQTPSVVNANGYNSYTLPSNNRSTGTGSSILNIESEVVCSTCGGPTKKLTVNKEGANKGRKFYNCHNAR